MKSGQKFSGNIFNALEEQDEQTIKAQVSKDNGASKKQKEQIK